MQTVPTLCATGSITIAASLGLGFGQTAVLPPPTPASSRDLDAIDGSASHKKHEIRSSQNFDSSPIPSLASSRPSRPPTPAYFRPTSSSPSIHLKKAVQGENLPTPKHEEPSSPAISSQVDKAGPLDLSRSSNSPTSVRRRPSRLRQRLSSWSVSFNSSPSPLDRPNSPSRATSAGSEDPFFPSSAESRRPFPNKLVKRSLSQKLPNGVGGDNTFRTHTLERPATSHKRLATLASDDWTGVAIDNGHPPEHGLHTDMVPAYFNSSLPRDIDPSMGRRRIGPNDRKFIKRILPKRSSPPPALCRSSCVAQAAICVDSSFPTEEDSFAFGRRPSSSSGLLNFFSSPAPDLHPEELDAGPKPRRSNSMTDFFSRNAKVKHRSKVVKVQLGSRRVTSAPASTMVEQTGGGSEGPSVKRRHIDTGSLTTGTVVSSIEPSLHHHFAHSDPVEASPTPTNPTQTVSGPPSSLHTPQSNGSFASGSRRSRHSAVFSDMNSDEDEMRSDTAYDSVRTGMTKSSSGYHGPALETLFDKDSPPQPNHEADQTLHLLGKTGSPSPATTKGQTIVEEDSSTSTPGRTITSDRKGSQDIEKSTNPQSSPPPTKALSLGRLSWDSGKEEDEPEWPESIDEEGWPIEDDPVQSTPAPQRIHATDDALSSVRRKLDFLSLRQTADEEEPKSNLFDWSEPAPVDRGLSNSPPPRPKTVHGRKNPDAGGNRANGRRAPSGLHARSQSVPVLADLANQKSTVTSKFGTWGIGSKGVTEDWNDDFDFEELPKNAGPQLSNEGLPNTEQSKPMVVPPTIKAHQTNVLANIGLLKEWGLLIEELKDLRNRASTLGIETDQHANIFDEVDAMIDLADQEVDHAGLSAHRSPTSSPGFDFDDPAHPSPQNVSNDMDNRTVEHHSEAASAVHTPLRSSLVSRTTDNSDAASTGSRPRKNSEAVAQSVIEALQKRRQLTYLSTPDQPTQKKIPFDTRTLRKIVPHVSGLVKSVKQIMREVEGLHSSPRPSNRSPEAGLQQAFITPSEDLFEEDEW